MTPKKRTAGPRSPTDVDKYVGIRIRSRRQVVGITQQDLAAKLGLTFQQVQKYEKGANRIGASRLVEVAHALDAPPGWFFEGLPGFGKQKPNVDDAVMSFLTDPQGVRIAAAFTNLPKDIRKAMADLVESTSAK